MSTRADFYVMKDGELELIGCTSNAYDGDFETAKNGTDYLKSVRELLRGNNSIEGKWYWPWKTSHITDEVFVFEIKPTWFNKNKGVLLSKVHVKECPDEYLYFVQFDNRYDERYIDEDGYYMADKADKIKLPTYQRA